MSIREITDVMMTIIDWILSQIPDFHFVLNGFLNRVPFDEALERLDQGTYGICEECDGEIGEKRLQAVPFALYCLECQRRKEQLKLTDSVSF